MKKYLFVIITLVLLAGCGEETVDIEGQAMNLEEIQSELSDSEKELESVKQDLFNSKAELSVTKLEIEENEERFEGLEELANNREQMETEIKEAEETLATLDEELEGIKDEIKAAQGELVKVLDEPISVQAGYFYFGSDIEPGRYQVKPQGNGSGNFFVRGTNQVNIILGNRRDSHVQEFTFEGFDGDELETKIPIYLYPVE